MASSGIELIAQNTTELSAGIKEVIASLKALERQSSENVKQVSAMDRAFGSQDGFDKFISSLKNLDKVQALAFKNISTGIASIANAADKIASIPHNINIAERIVGSASQVQTLFALVSTVQAFPVSNFEELGKGINLYANAVKNLVGIGAEKIFDALVKPLFELSKNISTGTDVVEGLNSVAFFFSRLPKLLQGINESMDFLGKLDTSKIEKFRDSVVSITNVKNIQPILDLFESVVRNASGLVQILNNTSFEQNQIIGFLNFMRELQNIIKQVLTFTSKISEEEALSLKNLEDYLNRFLNIVDKVSTDFIRIQDSLLEFNLHRFISFFEKVSFALKESKALEALEDVGDFDFSKADKALDGLNMLAIKLTSIKSLNIDDSITETIRIISNVFDKTFVENVDKIYSAIIKVGRQIALFKDYPGTEKGDFSVLNSITNFYKHVEKFAKTLTGLPSILGSINGSNISGTVEAIQSIVKKIYELKDLNLGGTDKLEKLINPGSISAVGSVFAQLSTVFKKINQISVKLPAQDKIKAILSVDKVFESIFKAIISITEIQENISNKKFDFKPDGIIRFLRPFAKLDDVFSLISEVSKRLSDASSKIKSVSKIEGLSNIIDSFITLQQALPKIFELSDEIKKLDVGGGVTGILVKIGVIKKISVIIAPLIDAFQVIAKKLSSSATNIIGFDLNKIEAVATITKSIGRIAILIPKLIKSIDILPALRGEVLINKLRPFAKLDGIFQILNSISSSLARITIKTAKLENVKRIGEVTQSISSIANAVPKILNAAERLKPGFGGYIERQTKTLPRFFGAVNTIALSAQKLTAKFTDVSALKAVTELITAVARIGSEIADAEKIDFNKFTGFNNFISQIAAGLNQLQNVRIGPEIAVAAAETVKAFSQIGSSGFDKLNKQSFGFLSNLSSTFLAPVVNMFKFAGEEIINVFFKKVGKNLYRLLFDFSSVKEQIAQQARDIGYTLQNYGRDFVYFGENLFEAINPAKLLESKGAKLALDFDDLTQQIKVFGGELKNQIPEVQALANELGMRSPLSANETLAAILDLSKAGQSFANIKNILPTAVDITALTNTKDLNKTVEFLIGAQGGFDKFSDSIKASFDNIGYAADVVFNAANIGTASIESLYEGLNRVAPAAKVFGASLDETAVLLSKFEDANIRGSDAGTALRAVFTGLSNDKGRKELNKLGIAFNDAQGNIRNISDILDDLKRRYKELGYSQTDILESTRQFGDELARTGISILLSGKSTNATLDELRAAIEGGSTAASAFQDITSSLKGRLQQLGGSVETLLTKVFLPMLNRFFAPAVTAVNKFVNILLSLPPAFTETASTVIFLASALGSFATTGAIVAGGVSLISGYFLSFAANVVLLTLKLPILIASLASVLSVMAALAPAVIVIGGGFLSLSSIITETFREIEDESSAVGKSFLSLRNSFGGVVAELTRIFVIARDVGAYVFGSLFSPNREKRLNSIASAFSKLSAITNKFSMQLKQIDADAIIRSLIKIREFAGPFIQSLEQISGGLFRFIFGDKNAIQEIRDGVSGIFTLITFYIQRFSGLDFTDALISFEAGRIKDGIREFMSTIKRELYDALYRNADRLTEITETFFSFINPFSKAENILNLFGLDEIGNVFSSIGDTINKFASGAINSILRVLGGEDLGTVLFENFGKNGAKVAEILSTIGSILSNIGDISRTVLSLFNPLFSTKQVAGANSLEDAIGGVLDTINDWANILNDNLFKPLSERLPSVLNFVTSKLRKFQNSIRPITDLLSGFGDGLKSVFYEIKTLISGDIDIGQFAKNIASKISSGLSEIPKAVGQTIFNIGKLIGSSFLENIGVGFIAGDSGYVFDVVISEIKNTVGNLFSRIPDLITSLGNLIGSNVIIEIGNAFKSGNIAKAINLIANGVINIVRTGIETAFNFLVNTFDDFLDRFQNRFVGVIVLFVGGIGATLVGLLARNIPFFIGQAISFIAPKIVALGAFIANTLNIGFVATLGSGMLLAIGAAIAGALAVLGTLIFTALNDPDIKTKVVDVNKTLGKVAGKTFTGAVDKELRKPDAIQKAIQALIKSLDLAYVFGDALNQVGDKVRKTVAGFVVGIFGEQATLIKGLFSELIALPFELAGTFLQAVSRIGQFVLNIIINGVYTAIKTAVVVIQEFVGRVRDFLLNVLNRARIGAEAIVGFFILIASRLLDLAGAIANGIMSFAKSVIGFINNILLIPSQIFQKISEFFSGILQFLGQIPAAATQLITLAGAITAVGVAIDKSFGERNFGKLAKNFAAVVVIGQALKALFSAIRDVFDKNIFTGILTFFQEFTTSLLNMVGLQDLSKQINTTFEQLKFLVEIYGRDIQRFFDSIFNRLLSSLAEIRARIEIAAADLNNAFGREFQDPLEAKQFFAIQDALTGATENAYEFFDAVGNGMKTALDPGAASVLLRGYADKVLDEFRNVVGSSQSKLVDLLQSPHIYDNLLFDNIVDAMFGAGRGYEILDLQISNLADTTQLLLNEKIVKGLGEDSGLGTALLENIFDFSKLGEFDTESASELANTLGNLVSEGVIEDTQLFRDTLEQLGFAFVNGAVVAKDLETQIINASYSFEEVNKAARDEALAKYNELMKEGAEDAEKFASALNELTDALKASADEQYRARFAELNEQLSSGEITSNEFARQQRKLIEDVYKQGLADIDVAYNELVSSFTQGIIDDKTFNDESEKLQEWRKEIERTRAIDLKSIELNIQLSNKSITPEEYAKELAEIGKKYDDELAEIGKKYDDELKRRESKVTSSSTDDFEADDDFKFTSRADEETRKSILDTEKAEEIRKDYRDKEDKANKDFLKKEAKLNRDIEKIAADYRKKISDIDADFKDKSIEDEKKYRDELLKISEETSDSVVDAVAARDSAAAQSAIRAAEQRKREAKKQQDELAIQREKEKQAALKDAYDRANEARAQRLEEINELRADHQERLREIRAERDEKLIANRAIVDDERRAAEARVAAANAANKGATSAANATANNVRDAFGNLVPYTSQSLSQVIAAYARFMQELAATTSKGGFQANSGNFTPPKQSAQNAPKSGFQANSGNFTPPRAPASSRSSSSTKNALDLLRRQTGGGRQHGGPVYPTMIHPVHPPELLEQDGKYYLIPGKKGIVIPPRAVSSSSGGNYSGGLNITFDFSGMQVTGTNVGVSDIISAAEERIIPRITSIVSNINRKQ